MDFMKVIDQAVREIKREVNIKVLKVPEIEQKVLDATSDEPWGPHGSALAEIAHATKKFTDHQLIMNVLWTRLTNGGRNWRHVYKALTVIEYLIAHGTERVLDDIIRHTYQISSLSGFKYVEPNGKDEGLNVRKKAETIMALLNDKDKIQEVRMKAAANRDKYFGLSSTGVTNKSSSASYGSSSFQHRDQYGGFSAKKEQIFKDSSSDRGRLGEDEISQDDYHKSRRAAVTEDEGSNAKKGPTHSVCLKAAVSSHTSRTSSNLNDSDGNYGPVTSQSSGGPDAPEDEFDPRGISTTGATASSVNQVDLFGDLMDAPVTVLPELGTTYINATTKVDLFADAAFVSAPHVEAGASSQNQANVDLFASQPAFSSASSSVVDFFASPNSVFETEPKSPETKQISSHSVDPFGAFTSHTNQVSTEPIQNSAKADNLNNLNQKPLTESRSAPKKDTFQVKSGIWADSLRRGLIDLNITASKKTNLADIGIVGGFSDGLDVKEKNPPPSVYMGGALGTGSCLAASGFTTPGVVGGAEIFSALSQHQQFGSFKK